MKHAWSYRMLKWSLNTLGTGLIWIAIGISRVAWMAYDFGYDGPARLSPKEVADIYDAAHNAPPTPTKTVYVLARAAPVPSLQSPYDGDEGMKN